MADDVPVPGMEATISSHDQGPVLLQQSDAVKRIPANGSAAFKQSCTPIG